MITAQKIPLNGTFPHGGCPDCGQEVLLYRDLDDAGELIHRCLDCDARVEPTRASSWGPEEVLEAGYPMEGILGEPEGSCGGGGCGGGSCSH